ncbi:hypothetical protein C2134_10225 [Chromobacterium sinusclupearum]|uniref:SMP-30/Gluconolactonase/LRE-like region domain-containing protein n=1 Tax=Chromobacterium sinusclupearum TaxID=2077146 RepID=A0A2K4MNX9_9NEIS|nr:hypothetical protein [Chromobacterium sinusclupearum]POA98722.1 hypothetical protein C2134_10225 [Chromobacterium sinusclupearum]
MKANFTQRRLAAALAALLALAGSAHAADVFLAGIKKHTVLVNTVPDNGDQNPYAIAVSPTTAGKLKTGDVLVDNFNNAANLQGMGSTIVNYHPDSKQMSLFAQIPRTLEQCPGGVGLSTAMTVLKSGWVIVGSTPSNDGTTDTKGAGCLMVLDSEGKLADVWSGPDINDPWGNMAVIDNGDKVTLFVSNAGFGVGSAKGTPPVVNLATVLRLELEIPAGKPPKIVSRTVVASGFGEQADKGVFLIGPTGLVYGKDDKLYVSDALGNRISEIWDATTRTTSAGIGRTLTHDGLLLRPLALTATPQGHLLATNGSNGKVVEIDPATGEQLAARWIDANKAQTPPGNGDLFGIALTPQGDGFYYVTDDNNNLVLAK